MEGITIRKIRLWALFILGFLVLIPLFPPDIANNLTSYNQSEVSLPHSSAPAAVTLSKIRMTGEKGNDLITISVEGNVDAYPDGTWYSVINSIQTLTLYQTSNAGSSSGTLAGGSLQEPQAAIGYIFNTNFKSTYYIVPSSCNANNDFLSGSLSTSMSWSNYNSRDTVTTTATDTRWLYYSLCPTLELNSTYYNFDNVNCYVQYSTAEWAGVRFNGWQQQAIQNVVLNGPIYKLKLVDKISNNTIYEDAAFVYYTTYRTININSFKMQNNADEPIIATFVNGTIQHSAVNQTSNVYSETQDRQASSLTITNSSESFNYSTVNYESNDLGEFNTILNATDQSGNYKGSETFASYANYSSPWVGYAAGFPNTWHRTCDVYNGHNKVYKDFANNTANRGVKKTISKTFGTDNCSFEVWICVSEWTTGALYWDLESTTGKYARMYYSSGDFIMDCDGSSTTVKTLATSGLSNDVWFTLRFEISPISSKWSLIINDAYWGTKTLTLNNVDYFGWITTGAYAKTNYIDSPSWTWATSPTYVVGDLKNLMDASSVLDKSYTGYFSETSLKFVKNLTIHYRFQSNISTQVNCSIYNYQTLANETLSSNCSTTYTDFYAYITTRTQNYLSDTLNFSIFFTSANTTTFIFNLSTCIVTIAYFNESATAEITPAVVVVASDYLSVGQTNNISILVQHTINPLHTIKFWDNISNTDQYLGTTDGFYNVLISNSVSQYYSIGVFVNDTVGNWKCINVTNIFIAKNISGFNYYNVYSRYVENEALTVNITNNPYNVAIQLIDPYNVAIETDINQLYYLFTDGDITGTYTLNMTCAGNVSVLRYSIQITFLYLYNLNGYFALDFLYNFSLFVNSYSSILTNYTIADYFVLIYDLYGNNVANETLTSADTEVIYTPANVRQCFISLHDQQNNYLNWEQFKLKINNTQIYDNSFYREIGSSWNLSVYNQYDLYITSTIHTITRDDNYIPIQITKATLKVYNQQEQFIHVNITYDPNYHTYPFYWSEWLAPKESTTYNLIPDYYRVTISNQENASTSIFAYNLVGDDLLLISSDNTLYNAIQNIQNVNTTIGNQITNVEINITNQNANINNTIINLNVNLNNINSTLDNMLVNLQTNITAIGNNITTLYVFSQNSFSLLQNNINFSFAEINSSIFLMNNSIYTAVSLLSADLTLMNNTIMGNMSIIIQLNEELTDIFINTMFARYLDWTNASINSTYIQNQVDVYSFLNNYRNQSIEVLLKYQNQVETLMIGSQAQLDQMLPNANVTYRVKSVTTGEYLTNWTPITNKTVNLGYYTETIPATPEEIRLEIKDYLMIALFGVVALCAIAILYVKSSAQLNAKSTKKKIRADGVRDVSDIYMTTSDRGSYKPKQNNAGWIVLSIIVIVFIVVYLTVKFGI